MLKYTTHKAVGRLGERYIIRVLRLWKIRLWTRVIFVNKFEAEPKTKDQVRKALWASVMWLKDKQPPIINEELNTRLSDF